MDMSFAEIDPDPTSLDIAPDGSGFVEGAVCPHDESLPHGCIVCGQALA